MMFVEFLLLIPAYHGIKRVMAKERKSGDDLDWDQVFSKGAYCIGGGFMVGCGLSVLTSSTWPVLFSTGVGLGLAVVNLENEMWNKGRKVTIENPWLKARERVSEDKPSEREKEIGRREGARSLETPQPHWRKDQEPVPAVPLDKDRAEHPEKDSRGEGGYSGKEYPGKEYSGKEHAEREYHERDHRDKEIHKKDVKPCPRAPKKKASKKKEEVKEKKVIEVESDPGLLVD